MHHTASSFHESLIRWFIALTVTIQAATPFTSALGTTTVAVTDIFGLPENGSFVDNIAISRGRSLFFTRIDVPEVWSVNLETQSGRLVHSFAQDDDKITSCFGITEIENNVFAVVAGKFDATKFAAENGSFSIWKLDFNQHKSRHPAGETIRPAKKDCDEEDSLINEPIVSKLAAIPQASALGASTIFNTPVSKFLLISDSPEGIIWKVDLANGEYTIALQDDSMRPKPDGLPMGVNGIKSRDGYLYYVNVGKKEFRRVRIDATASKAGPFELISAAISPDNFDIASDGTAYFATNIENSIVKLTPHGEVIQIAGSKNSTALAGPTCCALDWDEKTLYIGTNGGMMAPVDGVFQEPGKIASIEV